MSALALRHAAYTPYHYTGRHGHGQGTKHPFYTTRCNTCQPVQEPVIPARESGGECAKEPDAWPDARDQECVADEDL